VAQKSTAMGFPPCKISGKFPMVACRIRPAIVQPYAIRAGLGGFGGRNVFMLLPHVISSCN
jgi:hypothetical protein